MATIYLRSTGGNDGNSGADKDNAKATLQAAMTAAGAGGRVIAASDHAESAAATTTLTSPGTFAAPQEIVSINWATDALAFGAKWETGASNSLVINGCHYVYGWELIGANATNTAVYLRLSGRQLTPAFQMYDGCVLSSSGGVYIGQGVSGALHSILLRNCTIKPLTTYSGIKLAGLLRADGCSLSVAVATPSNLLSVIGSATGRQGPRAYLRNCDLAGASGNLVAVADCDFAVRLYRCRLHASATLASGTWPGPGPDAQLVECDSTTNYLRQAKADYLGTVTEDTVRIRDNSNSLYSHKLVSTANTKFYAPLRSIPVARLNVTAGSAITVRVDVLTDNVTLTNGEMWIEVSYLGSASYPLGSIASSAKADILVAASNLATSTEGWTTTDLARPVKQYATVTFTPQETGIIEITACLAKASTTVYVDPDVEVS